MHDTPAAALDRECWAERMRARVWPAACSVCLSVVAFIAVLSASPAAPAARPAGTTASTRSQSPRPSGSPGPRAGAPTCDLAPLVVAPRRDLVLVDVHADPRELLVQRRVADPRAGDVATRPGRTRARSPRGPPCRARAARRRRGTPRCRASGSGRPCGRVRRFSDRRARRSAIAACISSWSSSASRWRRSRAVQPEVAVQQNHEVERRELAIEIRRLLALAEDQAAVDVGLPGRRPRERDPDAWSTRGPRGARRGSAAGARTSAGRRRSSRESFVVTAFGGFSFFA
jgi:hypothetical protein